MDNVNLYQIIKIHKLLHKFYDKEFRQHNHQIRFLICCIIHQKPFKYTPSGSNALCEYPIVKIYEILGIIIVLCIKFVLFK